MTAYAGTCTTSSSPRSPSSSRRRSSAPNANTPGYTEFLHGLLKTEVDATEQRRLTGRLRFSK